MEMKIKQVISHRGDIVGLGSDGKLYVWRWENKRVNDVFTLVFGWYEYEMYPIDKNNTGGIIE